MIVKGMSGLRARVLRERGQVLVLAVVALPAILAMTAFVVDVGNYYLASRKLQAAADAAATAAASQLPNVAAATATAQQYSGSAGGKNASSVLPGDDYRDDEVH